jgi:hypothetical protein
MHVFAAGDKPGRAVQCVPDAPHHDTKRSRAPQTQDRCGLRRLGSTVTTASTLSIAKIVSTSAIDRSSTLNVIARALKRSNLAISDRLKPPITRWTCLLNFRCHCRTSPVGD